MSNEELEWVAVQKERVIERIAAQLNQNPRITLKMIDEKLTAEIAAGVLPPRSKTKFTPLVRSEIARQKELHFRRECQARNHKQPEPTTLLETLAARLSWARSLPKQQRIWKGGKYFQKLQSYFERRCRVCDSHLLRETWSNGYGQRTWENLKRAYDSCPVCVFCYARIISVDNPNASYKRIIDVPYPPKEAVLVPILAALFAINRMAKRYRDLSQESYRSRNHHWAGWWSARKHLMYELKSQALYHLHVEGRLQPVGYHKFRDNYAEVLACDGYRFHRPCPPPAITNGVVSLDQIEAKPTSDLEPHFADALLTVRHYLAGRPRVQVYDWPARPRPIREWGWDDWDDGYDGP